MAPGIVLGPWSVRGISLSVTLKDKIWYFYFKKCVNQLIYCNVISGIGILFKYLYLLDLWWHLAVVCPCWLWAAYMSISSCTISWNSRIFMVNTWKQHPKVMSSSGTILLHRNICSRVLNKCCFITFIIICWMM